MASGACPHLVQIKFETTDVDVCEDCVKIDGVWVHLRMCLICGHVACCDSSPNRHASKHAKATEHPLIRSIEPGEAWVWCFPDNAVVSELTPL